MGKSALLQAAEKGREEIVRLLLKNKANLDTKDKEGRTPLMCAALTGSTSVVALLLEHGVPVDATDKVRAAWHLGTEVPIWRWLKVQCAFSCLPLCTD